MNGTKEIMSLVVGSVLVLITALLCFSYNKQTEIQSMKSNIDSAIVKGIDPIAVRCAYGDRSDTICVAYAVTHNKELQVKK
jgi:hypothetical protein